MAQPTSSSHSHQAKLLKIYTQLSPARQRVLQLFAIAYTPIAYPKALECIAHMGIADDEDNVIGASQLNTHIDALHSIGLLKHKRGQSPQVQLCMAELITRDAIQSATFDQIASTVDAILPTPRRYRNGPRVFEKNIHFLRDLRLAIYRDRFAQANEIFNEYYENNYLHYGEDKLFPQEIILQVFNNPFDPAWLQKLPNDWHDEAIATILAESELYLRPVNEPFQYLVNLLHDNNEDHPYNDPHRANYLRFVLVQHLICQGNFQQAESVLEQVAKPFQGSAAVFWGWLNFLKGEVKEAIAHYTFALATYRKAKRKKKIYFNTIGGIFFILALLKDGSNESLIQASEYTELMAKQKGHWLENIYDNLRRMIHVQLGQSSQRAYLSLQSQVSTTIAKYSSFEYLINALCFYWIDQESATKTLATRLKPICDNAKAAGFDWLAMELADLISHTTEGKSYAQFVTPFLKEYPTVTPLTSLVRPLEPWEIRLKALTNIQGSRANTTIEDTEKRMAWMVTLYGNHAWLLQPREQKITKSGRWGKGRNIALKRLHDDRAQFDYLSAHDQKILAHLTTYRAYGSYYGGGVEYTFAPETMVALIGHPFVFWEESPTVRVDVVKGEPELLVEDKGNGSLIISFSLKPTGNEPLFLVKESPTRLKVIAITDDYHRISGILGPKNKLMVPISAKDQVLEAINSISSLVTVHSDIGGGMESVEDVPADATPHIHLLPSGDGLIVSLLCRPFSKAGPYYSPGTGGKNVIAEIDGQRLQTNRNLQQEKDLAQAVVLQCFPSMKHGDDETEWLLHDPEDCLELLIGLQDLGDSAVVEWPDGQTMNVRHRAGFGNFHVNIDQQQDWFTATGELKLNDDYVLGLRQLMTLLEQTNSRFIPIGDGEFIALTHEFRKRLDELRSFAEQHGDGLRFHPLASLVMDDMFEDMEHVKADKHWKANIKKIREMEAFQPELPSTLQAELRDYQQEGFEWMARLAYWGVGACLADDMGLGKTLQALSVLLTRVPHGPALIIAPTSVGMNWISEAQKFAPTLNPLQFGSGDRQRLLDHLKPFDMLVCTYGLLQQDDVAEMLAKVAWEMIVLDEAQAIKNANTKRSKAAMQLQSPFKVLTTGTPIENHLGELWNLFRFINPGLLGSMETFNQNFAYPIERDSNKPARNRLKRLISPFILRRTKSQVLDELPSRTEITLQVELSKDEMAMYEALRREAVDRISDSGAGGGAKHLQVLAEIMKLRRMCCNPKLILPDTDLSGAKLELFGETLTELLANRHKALVFSQFVDHLTLIKNDLDAKNIRYQYLDGQTPAKLRKKRVDAFQSGDGDVFLISLKAGGTGLNLTAADYVIHMDPWWNPAVEDQASDRAHRIGQKRPVTIYRLVTKGTIEEKIVALHAQKRDLADSLLDGTDMSGKISTDDLIKLMSEG